MKWQFRANQTRYKFLRCGSSATASPPGFSKGRGKSSLWCISLLQQLGRALRVQNHRLQLRAPAKRRFLLSWRRVWCKLQLCELQL